MSNDASSNNLSVWSSVCNTPRQFLKSIPGSGKTLTEINPTYRVMKMTEAFGPLGVGWSYRIARDGSGNPIERTERSRANERIEIYKVLIELSICTEGVWHVAGEQWGSAELVEIFTRDKGEKVVDKLNDAHKSAITDALGKLMSHLGVGADVYMQILDRDGTASYAAPTAQSMQQASAKQPTSEVNANLATSSPSVARPSRPAATASPPSNGTKFVAYKDFVYSTGKYVGVDLLTPEEIKEYGEYIMDDAKRCQKELRTKAEIQQLLTNLCVAVERRHPRAVSIQYTDMGQALDAWDWVCNNLARECTKNELKKQPEAPRIEDAESVAAA